MYSNCISKILIFKTKLKPFYLHQSQLVLLFVLFVTFAWAGAMASLICVGVPIASSSTLFFRFSLKSIVRSEHKKKKTPKLGFLCFGFYHTFFGFWSINCSLKWVYRLPHWFNNWADFVFVQIFLEFNFKNWLLDRITTWPERAFFISS